MQINIDSEVLQAAMDGATSEAIQQAFREWKVRNVIKESLAGSVIGEALGKAIEAAADQMDVEALTETMAEMISSHLLSTSTYLIREAAVDMAWRLELGDRYASEEQIAAGKARIRARLAGEPEPPVVTDAEVWERESRRRIELAVVEHGHGGSAVSDMAAELSAMATSIEKEHKSAD